MFSSVQNNPIKDVWEETYIVNAIFKRIKQISIEEKKNCQGTCIIANEVLSNQSKYSYLFDGYASCISSYKSELKKHNVELETLVEKAAEYTYKKLFNEKLELDELSTTILEINNNLMQLYYSMAPKFLTSGIDPVIKQSNRRIQFEKDQLFAKREKEIEITQKRLIIADESNRPITAITEEDVAAYDLEVERSKKDQLKKESAEADKNLHEFLSSLENESKKKSKPKGSQNKGKKTAPKTQQISKPQSESATETQNKKEPAVTKKKKKTPSAPKVTGMEQRNEFVASLYKNSIKELARVTERWMTHDPEVIRQFIDFDKNGVPVQRYIRMDDEEIEKQRAFHFLPGLEKILASKVHKKIYTFPTNRGCGIYADLMRGEERHLGAIYLGIGMQDKVVFHKYFEEKEMNDPDLNGIFNDKEEVPKNNNNEAGWDCSTNQIFEMDEKGVLTISFPGEDHYIRLYPVRKDLIKPELLNN